MTDAVKNSKEKFGLVGARLTYSYSKDIHEKLGYYSYNLFPMNEEEFNEFMTAREFSGLNVTIPYKEKVMKYCDIIDPIAENIGAVNTVYTDADGIHGTNTDYAGFCYMVKRAGIDFKDKKVIILGSGGASKMAQVAAADMGASEVLVVSRRGEINYENAPKDAQIIVNTTPVGTYPDTFAQPIKLADFTKCEGLVDVIYNPSNTALMQEAQELGIRNCGGLAMLVAQATAAAMYFAKGRATQEEMDKATEETLRDMQLAAENVVFIGMPGSGKSHIGHIFSDNHNMIQVDTDEEITKEFGRTPEQIINEDGEPAFREMESQVVQRLAREHGQVISTGGGSILNPMNVKALKQNGFVVYLDRPLEKLATKGRPLSKKLESLYEKRSPIYEAACDAKVENSGSLKETITKLEAIYKEHVNE